MSVKVMSWVFDHSRSSGTDRLVLLVLADHADDERWQCWPGQKRLADKANMTARNVKRCITNLVHLGEVEVLRQGTGATTSLYRITPTASVTPDIARTPTASVTPTADVTGGVPPVSGEGVPPQSPKPSIEPSVNHQENGATASPLAPFEAEFSKLWEILPKRKGDSRKEALRCYQARRREGITAVDLLTAASNYRDDPERKNKPEYTLSAKTFLGPNEKWRSSLETESTTQAVTACPECLVSGTHTPDCSQRRSSNAHI